jgi:hypothetical protein
LARLQITGANDPTSIPNQAAQKSAPVHHKKASNMNPDLQKLQDMLIATRQQRDQALNAVVVAQAEIASLARTLAERDATIKQLMEKMGALSEKPAPAQTPRPAFPVIPGMPNGTAVAR